MTLSYVRYCIRLWLRERPEKIAIWVAWRLPRQVALWAFIRVCSAQETHPDDITYRSAHDAWISGKGR